MTISRASGVRVHVYKFAKSDGGISENRPGEREAVKQCITDSLESAMSSGTSTYDVLNLTAKLSTKSIWTCSGGLPRQRCRTRYPRSFDTA